MKNISLFTKWLGLLMTLLAMSLPTWAQMTEDEEFQQSQEINGKITWQIETKKLTLQQAQAAIEKQTTLTVSLIFEGDWVGLFDRGFRVRFNPSSFSYGIAQSASTNTTPAPLFTNNPPAWMGAYYGMCQNENGTPVNAVSGNMLVTPSWMRQGSNNCPTYDYGCVIPQSVSFADKGTLAKKQKADGTYYYELAVFPITFYLKRIENVYVRNIDDAGTYHSDNKSDLYATSGITELNINKVINDAILYWPGAPKPDGKEHPESADWTQAPSQYYGGVIPGGIFIEQVPDVTQFERSFIA